MMYQFLQLGQRQIRVRNRQKIPHVMEPVAAKERFLRLPVSHPEPRAPERALVLDDALCGCLEIRLGLGRARRGHDLFHVAAREGPVQRRDQVLWLGEVAVLLPEGVEDGQEGGFEERVALSLFDVG
jgi:hypothetical protein